MEAFQPRSSNQPVAEPQKPRELCWAVILSVEAEVEFQYLRGTFEEFEPAFRSLVGQMAWADVTPRTLPRGIYEVVIPEGRTMPTIRIQYAVTDRALVIQNFERSELIGSPAISRKNLRKR